MSDANPFSSLSADLPLINPKLDRFGYAPFAESLAKALCNMHVLDDGFVIGIYARWGSGKSTLLNFVRYYLDNLPLSYYPLIIVPFNPWWFSGQENIARHLFDKIERALSPKRFVWFRRPFRRSIRKAFATLADAASDIPWKGAPFVKAAGKIVQPTQIDIENAKKQIDTKLRSQANNASIAKILVLIDDVDRLTAEEIRQLFSLIKTVADLPNVVYLLAFDDDVVCKALSSVQDLVSGTAYLEKIVQLPIHLPKPSQTALYQLLMDKLQRIFSDSAEFLPEQRPEISDDRNQNKWQIQIMKFITSPRDIVRLINALSVTYYAVKGEVDPVDFTIMEVFRVFRPFIYDTIRTHRGNFVGIPQIIRTDSLGSGLIEPFRSLYAFHHKWLDKVDKPDIDAVKTLLAFCFPILDAVFFDAPSPLTEVDNLSIKNKVCIDAQFDRYFRFTIADSDISNAEMHEMLALSLNEDKFIVRLLEWSRIKAQNVSRAQKFLFRLQEYARSNITEPQIPSLIRALFRVGDDLLLSENQENLATFALRNNEQIFDIIPLLLARLKEPERFKLVRDAIEKSNAITTIVFQAFAFGQEHGKYGSREPQSDPLLDGIHLAGIEELTLEKIEAAVKYDNLFRTPNLPRVIQYWFEWSPDEAKKWFSEFTQSDSAFLVILKKFSVEAIDSSGIRKPNIYLEILSSFCPLEQVANRVRSILDNFHLNTFDKEFLEHVKSQLDSSQC